VKDHESKVINMTSTAKHGIELLRDPSLNKSTAFAEAEKQALGLIGRARGQARLRCWLGPRGSSGEYGDIHSAARLQT